MDEFPRTIYKHRDPLTMTVNSQDEQDKYLPEGWSLNHRPQEQIDQSEYLREHPEATEPAVVEEPASEEAPVPEDHHEEGQ